MNLNEITVKNYNGIGTLIEDREDGERKYIGEYYDGREHGIGVYTSKSGKHKYAGQFYENKVEGIGIKKTDDNDGVYCGEYRNNQKEGLGYWKFPNGATFVGEFNSNSPNGFGVLITWEGLKFIGIVTGWFFAVEGKWYNKNNEEIDITKLGYKSDGTKIINEEGREICIYPNGAKHIKGHSKIDYLSSV